MMWCVIVRGRRMRMGIWIMAARMRVGLGRGGVCVWRCAVLAGGVQEGFTFGLHVFSDGFAWFGELALALYRLLAEEPAVELGLVFLQSFLRGLPVCRWRTVMKRSKSCLMNVCGLYVSSLFCGRGARGVGCCCRRGRRHQSRLRWRGRRGGRAWRGRDGAASSMRACGTDGQPWTSARR